MSSKGSGRGLWFHVLNLFTGTGLAQVINLGVYPVLTRLYTPVDFGLLAGVTALAVPLSVVVCLGYEPALVLERDSERARSLFSFLLMGSGLAALLTIPALLLWGRSLEAWLNAPGMARLVWWIPAATLGLAWNRLLDSWMARHRRFPLMAGGKVVGAALGSALKVAWGACSRIGASGLLAGFVVCEAGKTGTALLRMGKEAFPAVLPGKGVLRVLGEHRNLPRYYLPYVLLQYLTPYLPALVFFRFFGAQMVGFFALGLRMVSVPVELAAHSMAQVFYRESVSRRHAQGELATLLERTAARLLLIGLVPFGVLTFAGSRLFGLLFGGEWSVAGGYVQLLAPSLYLQFVNAPLVLFNTLGKQRAGLFWQIQLFSATLVGLLLGVWLRHDGAAVSLFSAALFFSHLRLGRLNFGFCGARWRRVPREMGRVLRSLLRR